ncbi:MAG: ATP-binding protein [Lachnospiraceae bacterium]|nr:ATP-binding protein [Lachnospiraceae bacterium]
MNWWTLHVEEFGKIKAADVTIAPLTMFIGDNNSGKSYMTTLIYGLLNLSLDQYEMNETSETYAACEQVLEKIQRKPQNSDRYVYSFSKTDIKCFEMLLNEILKINQLKFIKELFNKNVSLKCINVEFSEETIYQLNVNFAGTDERKKVQIQVWQEKDSLKPFTFTASHTATVNNGLSFVSRRSMIQFILETLLRNGHCGTEFNSAVYLPISRTGFLLTYKTLIGSAIEDKFNLKTSGKNLLTRPNSDFLKGLSSIQVEEEWDGYSDCIEFIENKILCGSIEVSQLPSHDIFYHPAGSDAQLPMFVSSGVVTEMTPLLLYLRYIVFDSLMIEEPEICLHPELQWRMMQLLIRIQNKGVPVFATTHSDFMLQHMNNMIKVNEMQHKDIFLEKNDYLESDLLERKNTAVYQFDVDSKSGQSVVTRLKCGDYGYELQTFYETLKKMNQQIDEIERTEE